MTNKSDVIRSLSLDEIKKLARQKKIQTADKTQDEIQRCTDVKRKQFPLTSSQKSMWMLDQYLEDKRAYNNSYAFVCHMALEFNQEQARHALTLLTRKHTILRTTFQMVNGEVMQCISDDIIFNFVYEDIVTMPEEEKKDRIDKQALKEGRRIFDLSRGPLSYWRVIKTQHNEYVMMLTLHHIISDGWTMNLFFRELMGIYFQLENGIMPAVDDFLQFSDYALAENQWQINGHYNRGLAYWKKQLDGVQGILNIPTDAPRPAQMNSRGSIVSQTLDRDLQKTLSVLCSHHNSTLFHAMLTAWQVLLYFYSGQNEIIVGIPFANRNHAASRDLMGLFMNPLPLRGDIRAESRFDEILAQVRANCAEAMLYQDVPFNMILDNISFVRSPRVNPLFQAMLCYQVFPHFYEDSQTSIKPLKVDYGVSKTELDLWVEEDSDKLLLTLYYNSTLYRESTARQMLEHFQLILRQFVNNPHITLAQISLLSDEKRSQYQAWSPQPQADFVSVHQQLVQVANNAPYQMAVRCDDRVLNYQQVEEQSENLAQWLLAEGLQPGNVVGIHMEKGIDCMIAIMAILRAGGCYLPLDITLPHEQLEYMIYDAAARWMLTESDNVTFDGVTSLNIHVTPLSIARQPLPNVVPDAPACIIYTSGSTGTPKGVQVNHAQLACCCDNARQILQQPTGAHYGMFSSFTTDLAHTMIFPALTSGGCLNIISNSTLQDPLRLTALLTHQPLDCIKITPSHFSALLNGENVSALLPSSVLVLGGERVPWSLVEHLRALNARCRILNHYGTTESTVEITTWEAMPDTQLPAGSYLPIGKPFPCVQLLILDNQFQPLADGLPGEICIGGALLSAGYIGSHSHKNASAFIPHPLLKDERLYRTGDKGRYLPDGNIEYLGRFDRQVKIRGFQVELAEIENVLHQCSGVTQAAALVKPISDDEQQLLVFFATAPGWQQDDIKNYARAQLPHFMLPDRWLWLESMPLTTSGKINYTWLNTLTLPHDDITCRRPQSETERLLHRLYCSMLNLSDVGIDDSFFQLDGNSINALKLVMQVNQQFGISLSLGQLIEHSSISQLAQFVEKVITSQALTSLVTLNKGNESQPTFLMVHPAGGNVLCYYPMLKPLGSRYPVYALQVADFSQINDYDREISSLAAFYLRQTGDLIYRQKLIIGGWSLGATIAFEMGQQIASITGLAPTLLVFDQPAPQMRVDNAENMSDSKRLVYYAHKVAMFTGTHFNISEEKLAAMSHDERTYLFMSEFQRAGLVPASLSFEYFRHFLVIFWAHINASDRYIGAPYSGNIVVAEAQEDLPDRIRLPVAGLGWQSLADKAVIILPAQGNHVTMMKEPFITELIQRVKQVLP
ncbi:non-ribosomal peptide synthetase [Xenorhabdus griffiniae]|uniref:non-ribosomal peptide synthetase n=1 Tax=Xenorhabdus griffiniae TaxID=351672 RepID=UPI002358DAAF|nr:amino acid adenylation domain-containing protein [Xenorhabdus griffiniae]MDC9606048.1 amino acid adenylation domain-containing protein [Xenorhabdus griffiniae]